MTTTKRSKGIQKLVMALMLFLCILVLPVNAKAAAPKLTKKQVTLTVGKSTTLTVKNAKGKVRWKSSRSSVASVKKTGAKKAKITAKKAGTAKITAKVGKKKLTCKVTVKKASSGSTAKKAGTSNESSTSSKNSNVPSSSEQASGSQTGETEEVGEPILTVRSELRVGSLHFCKTGDCDVFAPAFILPKPTAEEGIAWIASLSEEEREYTKNQIQESSYGQELKDELISILNGESSMDDTYQEELYSRCCNYLSRHGFDENHGSTSIKSVYYYGPWVEIPESEYEAWAALNIR